MPHPSLILTLNAGSSSIKFATFTTTLPPTRQLVGEVERIGNPAAQIRTTTPHDPTPESQPLDATTYPQAADRLITYLQKKISTTPLVGIGHRVVHGGLHISTHQPITPQLLQELRTAIPLDPAHLPRELSLIDAFAKAFPTVPQFACFDTVFHHDMPTVAKLLPIPRRYYDQGIRRLGFHGLSYTYLMQRLTELAGPAVAQGRIILAHLGSGASMAAVHHGKPIDTTMAFTPTAGLVMGTRPGDLDPGLLTYLMRSEKRSPDDMDKFLSEQCGLLGLSETSADMRDLLHRRATDPCAADAVNAFVYQAKKYLGALATTLGGLDTLIFSGGIGERSPEVRAAICENLPFLGIALDPAANAKSAPLISFPPPQSRVSIRVIPTDEELIIAQTVHAMLPKSPTVP
jgi:acetate kinase